MGQSPLSLSILPTPIKDISAAETKIREIINRLDHILRYLKQDTVKNEKDITDLTTTVAGLSGGSGIPFPDPTNVVEITEDNYDAAHAYQLLEADSGKMVQLQDTVKISYAVWYFKLPNNPAHGTYYWIKQGGGKSSIENLPYLSGQLYVSADPIVAILYNSTPRVLFSDDGTIPDITPEDRMLVCYMYIKESHVFYNGSTNKTCVGYWLPIIGTIG